MFMPGIFLIVLIVLASLAVVNSLNVTVGNPAQVSLAFYYDYFADRAEGSNELAIPVGVETVFGGNYGNEPISLPGAVRSIRMKPVAACTSASECFTYENVIAALNVYEYVHMDEISYDSPCPECATVIQQVGDTPGYGGRIIVFFRYSLSGIGLSDQYSVIDLAMKGYIRKIFFETYPSAHNQCDSYLCTSNSATACEKLVTWSTDIAVTYPGANIVFSPTFGLRNGIELDVCASDRDSLYTYFSCMHANQVDWKGAAFFGASQCTGCSGVYSYNDVAQDCAGLLSWWNGK